jgi:FkbM family methyltransferase
MSDTLKMEIESGCWLPVSGVQRLFGFYCRVLPEHPAKLRIIRALATCVFKRGIIVRKVDGKCDILIDPLDAIGMEILRHGGYEPNSIAHALHLIRDGGIFVDIGANFGLYSIPIASLPRTACVAVDASALAITKLRNNLVRNSLSNVPVVNAALGNRKGLLAISTVQPGNLGSTRVVEATADQSSQQWVPCIRLDAVLQQLLPHPKRIQLLKVDVEGFEQPVLASLDFQGEFRPKNILMECDPDGFAGAGGAFAFVLSQGYAAFSIDGEPVADCSRLPEHNVWFRDTQ